MYIFAIILCFLKEKTNKFKAVSFDIAETDNMPQLIATNEVNERCIIYYKFIFITPPASIQIIVNLWFNSQYLLNSNALMGSW